MKWFVDYGHGGNDSGAVGFDGKVLEKNVNKLIGERVTYHLKRHSQEVIETRENDSNPTLTERVNKIKATLCDIGISIHCNASIEHNAHGMETYTWGNGTREMQLAKCVHNQIKSDGLNREDRGIKQAQFTILSAPIPCVLVECDFIDTEQGQTHLLNNIENYAISITKGLLAFYNMQYKNEVENLPPTSNKLYYVQVGAYSNKSNAQNMVNELKLKGYNAIIKEG